MRKISLDLDALQVESFATAPATRPLAGTVHGHDATEAYCITDITGCCQTSETSCLCDSYGCPGATLRCEPSHMASCGDECDITGIPYKCNNYTEIC